MLFSFFLSLARRYTYSCNKNLNSILVLRHLPSRLRVLASSLTSSSSLAIRQRTFLGGCLSKFAKTLSVRNFQERMREKGEKRRLGPSRSSFLVHQEKAFRPFTTSKGLQSFLADALSFTIPEASSRWQLQEAERNVRLRRENIFIGTSNTMLCFKVHGEISFRSRYILLMISTCRRALHPKTELFLSPILIRKISLLLIPPFRLSRRFYYRLRLWVE